ncbi:MAG: orotidine-5'-phosphate decarboxylase [Nitrospirae bacterium]|nr:orotidine-5'-phosphate decarboxylase [Nitrospirota bacterium]
MLDRIILALDTPSLRQALEWVASVESRVNFFKIGVELFSAEGPHAVEKLKERGLRIFLDLKYHDVPATVAKACRAVAPLGLDLLNVHALGGEAMMHAAAETLRDDCARLRVPAPKLIAVTLLTSLESADLEATGISRPMTETVERLAQLARASGLDGVVCSPHEITLVRRACGDDFLLVTPGIRMPDSPPDDQKRKATPREALAWGADYLVLGRPVWQSPDPAAALDRLAAP